MKTAHTFLLLGLLLCGCSNRQTTPAIDLVQTRSDVTWNFVDTFWSKRGTCILHVSQRDDSSLKGIRLDLKTSDGKEATLTADTGSLLPGSVENAADKNCVRIKLVNATFQSSDSRQHLPPVIYVLLK
jgi:hypothetical protein